MSVKRGSPADSAVRGSFTAMQVTSCPQHSIERDRALDRTPFPHAGVGKARLQTMQLDLPLAAQLVPRDPLRHARHDTSNMRRCPSSTLSVTPPSSRPARRALCARCCSRLSFRVVRMSAPVLAPVGAMTFTPCALRASLVVAIVSIAVPLLMLPTSSPLALAARLATEALVANVRARPKSQPGGSAPPASHGYTTATDHPSSHACTQRSRRRNSFAAAAIFKLSLGENQ